MHPQKKGKTVDPYALGRKSLGQQIINKDTEILERKFKDRQREEQGRRTESFSYDDDLQMAPETAAELNTFMLEKRQSLRKYEKFDDNNTIVESMAEFTEFDDEDEIDRAPSYQTTD